MNIVIWDLATEQKREADSVSQSLSTHSRRDHRPRTTAAYLAICLSIVWLAYAWITKNATGRSNGQKSCHHEQAPTTGTKLEQDIA